jgi:superfamily I DNA/RNA helicase
MDSGREISVDLREFRHLDYGYAVTSHSAQGLTFDRVLVNADTKESARLLNSRTAYVAISRARYDALIYTDSTQNLSDALNREIAKETALGAIQDEERERKEDREKVIKEPEAVAALISRGKVIEIADKRERFQAIAQDYCKDPNDTLVISPGNR